MSTRTSDRTYLNNHAIPSKNSARNKEKKKKRIAIANCFEFQKFHPTPIV